MDAFLPHLEEPAAWLASPRYELYQAFRDHSCGILLVGFGIIHTRLVCCSFCIVEQKRLSTLWVQSHLPL
ncbi:unnamed protein product [Victoria cruziana]